MAIFPGGLASTRMCPFRIFLEQSMVMVTASATSCAKLQLSCHH